MVKTYFDHEMKQCPKDILVMNLDGYNHFGLLKRVSWELKNDDKEIPRR